MFPGRVAAYESVLPMYPRAVEYWRQLDRQLGGGIEFGTGGGLMVAESDAQMRLLADKIGRERAAGVDTALIDRDALLKLAPYLNPELAGAALCSQEGKVNPLLANAAISKDARRAGASFISDMHVEQLQREKSRYRIHGGDRELTATRVVIAAGAGSGALLAQFGIALPVRPEPLHMNVTEAAQPFMRHLIQHTERPITMKQLGSGQLLIGGGWPADDRGATPPGVRADSINGNLRLASHLVPAVAPLGITRTWAGINTMVDLVSVIGSVPGSAGLHCAIPGDAGYTLGPYCAQLLVDHLSGRATDFPLQDLSIERFR
jgi:glycine/D-amino acid oxidase-like deaminating enzyme